MNRRLFINQASTALLLPFLPFSGFCLGSPQKKGILDADVVDHLAQQIQHGLLGTIQQIAITHTYSPETLGTDDFDRIAQQDVGACLSLAGLQPLTNSQLLTQASPAPLFGSCAVELGTDSLQLTWQALAQYGIASKPVSCQLRVFGSKGILQTINNGQDYQIQDLTGHIIQQTANNPTISAV